MKKIISICLITILSLSAVPAFPYSSGISADTPLFYNLNSNIFSLTGGESITAVTTIYNYTDETANSALITALYTNNKLCDIRVDYISVSSWRSDEITTTQPLTIPANCSNYSVKAFAVNNLNSISPLCKTAEITPNTTKPELINLIDDNFSQAPNDIPLTAENEKKCIDTYGLYAKSNGYAEGNPNSEILENNYITYYGNFSNGKVSVKVGNSDEFYRNTVLPYYGLSFYDVGSGRYDCLVNYFWGNNFHIYAGSSQSNMKEVPFTWTGGSEPGLAFALATTNTLSKDTCYVKISIDRTNWINRLYNVKILGYKDENFPSPQPEVTDLITNDDFSQAPKDVLLSAESEKKCVNTFGLYAKSNGYAEGNPNSDVHENDYITYHGNFSGGKVTAKVGNSPEYYRDTVLAYYGLSVYNVGWNRYNYLIDYFWGENFHIYAGNSLNNMKEIPFTWLTGGTVSNSIYAIVTTEALPIGTAYVKVKIDNTNWLNRLYYVQISGNDSEIIPTPPPDSIYNASVTLNTDKAEAGVPITAITNKVFNPRYTWYEGGKKIDNVSNTYIPKEEDKESFIKVVVSSDNVPDISAQVYFSSLPVIYINTEDGDSITSREYYKSAKMHIQGNSKYNTDTVKLYDGDVQIKGRGNSTWGFPKKPYKIKLNEKTKLFGMSKSKHWVLLANYLDESLMRNALATDFSEKIGMNAMNTQWVNLVVNGEYAGNYQLYEEIRPENDRVNIFDWEDAAGDIADAVFISHQDTVTAVDRDSIADMLTENLGWITDGRFAYKGITYNVADYYTLPANKNGGFLFQFSQEYDAQSQFRTTRNEPIMIEYPKYLNTNTQMFNYLRDYINSFESAVYNADGCYAYDGKYLSYADLADMDSIAKYWLVSQFMCNEIDYKSVFMYMDINDKLHFGPPWDFDFSSGAENPWGVLVYDAWRGNSWFAQMRQSPYFAIKVQELFYKYLNTMHSYTQSNGFIDQTEEYIGDSAEANSLLWFYKRGHDADVAALKDWLNNRISWMNSQLIDRQSLEASFRIIKSPKVTFTVTDQYGNALTPDNSQYAVSDGIINSGNGLSVTVDTTSTSTTKFNLYVNGIYRGYANVNSGTAQFNVPSEYLTEAVGTNNVIMVYGKNSSDSFTYMNYITIKQK